MNKKVQHSLEIVWLIIAIITLTLGIHGSFIAGFRKSYIFFIMSALAFLFFRMRRYMRKKMDH